MPSDYRARLDKLHHADFDDRPSFVLRHLCIVVAATVLFLATGEPTAPIWAIIYAALQVLHFAASTSPKTGSVSALRFYAALSLYGLTIACFVTLPLKLILHPDPIYHLTSAIGLAGAGFYFIQRHDPGRDVAVMDGSMFSLTLIVVNVQLWPMFSDTIDRVAFGMVCTMAILFYVRALVGNYQRQTAIRNAENRYAHAQKARALNQFVGGVAHEFNNHLTAILGNLELFELLSDQSERREALGNCREAAARSALIVKQLVASSGRTRLAPKEIDFATLTRQLGPVLRTMLSEGVTLTLPAAATPVTGYVDQDALETCLVQLVLNAQDAGGPEARIAISSGRYPDGFTHSPALEAPAPHVYLCVEDDGPGVEDHVLPLLPEPFFTTKNTGDGPGLGLSAVQGFAKQSGGVLTLSKSELGGLRACIILPERAHSSGS